MTRAYLFSAILLICAAIAAAQGPTNCFYTFSTKTGDPENASTDGLIDLVFGKDTQYPYQITDLKSYGIMGPDHTYFQRNQLDDFRFDGPCDLRCPVDLQYTLRGNDHDWYVEYFIINASLTEGNHTGGFTVNKWFTGGFDHLQVDFCQNGTCVPIYEPTCLPTASNVVLAMPF